MSNKDQNKDQDQKDGNGRSPQVGALLRASRLRVGEDLREVADILCIRFLYLEAIEECRYGDLPGNTYAVGFIRSYAEHLGLDGDEVVRRYRVEQAGHKSATDLAFPTPVPDSGVPKGAIVFIGVLIALLVYGGWYVSTTDDSILSDLISPVPDHLKHLVTGDNAAPATDKAAKPEASSEDAATPRMTETASEEIEKVVRETTAAAQQMASDAGAAAKRGAETADDAAETVAESTSGAADAVVDATQQAVTATTQAVQTAAEGASEKVEKVVEPTATESLATSTPAATGTDNPPKPSDASSETPANSMEQTQPVESAATSAAPAANNPVADTPAPVETAATVSATTESTAAAAPAPAQPAEQTPAQAVEGTTTSVESAAVDAPKKEPAPPEVTAEDLNALVLRQATGVSGVRTAPAAPETAANTSGEATGTSGIVIRANSSSWVEIRNPANGSIVYTGLMNAGSVYNVPDINGLILDTGNAGALKITVDGKAVPEIGGVGAVRKNVPLDPVRLKAGTASSR